MVKIFGMMPKCVTCAVQLEDTSRVLRFYFLNSPPHLSGCLFHVVNGEDGTYSGDSSMLWAMQKSMQSQPGSYLCLCGC
jgi:hypothetical protein